MTSKNHNKVRKELGDKLKKAREQAKLTQLEVATTAGVNVNYYAQIERGEVNPSFEKLESIRKALGIKSLGIL
jgi:transcriptional regulator with XRE-family HTH domain